MDVSWTIKKAEGRRIDAFELWCWRRLLRVPWIARRSNQSKLKEISPEYSLEGLMLKLKLQYFGHLMLTHWKRLWCWERLKSGGEGDSRGWDGWMASPTGWTRVWASSGSWWWTGKPGMPQTVGLQSRTQLTIELKLCLDFSTIKYLKPKFLFLVNFSQIYLFLCLKSTVAACFGHFLSPYFYESSMSTN